MGPWTAISARKLLGRRIRPTARVKVATRAQMKLCHIVRAENVWFISLESAGMPKVEARSLPL